ncbi:hypothetical protein CLPU_6c00860 [Gottschalkia purinilytica]|uniref:Uncharacterized protein n=1 Tax=Gottschalkia purinilytica TaxID=1503 RepID=A0A0L0WB89_GOTPU|nr:hypothetical protein [Gottschalkia purinilytica]KNF08600.1 hypothetical protein CLPU_6c00860 [Gottschalkia purinilytica]
MDKYKDFIDKIIECIKKNFSSSWEKILVQFEISESSMRVSDSILLKDGETEYWNIPDELYKIFKEMWIMTMGDENIEWDEIVFVVDNKDTIVDYYYKEQSHIQAHEKMEFFENKYFGKSTK